MSSARILLFLLLIGLGVGVIYHFGVSGPSGQIDPHPAPSAVDQAAVSSKPPDVRPMPRQLTALERKVLAPLQLAAMFRDVEEERSITQSVMDRRKPAYIRLMTSWSLNSTTMNEVLDILWKREMAIWEARHRRNLGGIEALRKPIGVAETVAAHKQLTELLGVEHANEIKGIEGLMFADERRIAKSIQRPPQE
jgi:hypothetical protein